MNNKQLFRLSKYAYNETFLDATLQQMGANQAKFIEQINKSKNYLKTQSVTMDIVIFIYTAALIIFPIQAFMKIQAAIEAGIPSNWVILAGTLTIGLFFFIQVGYMLLFGMLQASSLISGDAFKWLTTLPVPIKELEKVVMFTFFRGVRMQLIVLAIIFPVGIGIVTGSWIHILVSIVISITSTIFSFSLLVVVGEKVNRVMQSNDVNTPKSNLIRIGTMLGIALGSMVIVVVFQFAIQAIDQLFANPTMNSEQIDIINYVLSLIPFPFAGNLILAELSLSWSDIPLPLWITSIIGLIFFIQLARSGMKRALGTLKHVIFFEPKRFSIESVKEQKPVLIDSISPVKAYMKKDLSMATRDYQMIMFLVFPIILPVFGVVVTSMSMNGQGSVAIEETLMMSFVLGVIYGMMGALMLIFGLLSVESSGASIMASLPISVRDQAKGKVNFLIIITIIAQLLPCLIQINAENYKLVLPLTLVSIPMGTIFGLIGMELKVRFFGKLHGKYILEEFHFEYKILKWIFIIAIELVLAITAIVGGFTLIDQSISLFVVVFLSIEAVLLVIVGLIFNKMFPVK